MSGVAPNYRAGYLMHYGIKGQKWGVRRFQNQDRTWTEAGKERYGHKGERTRKKSIKSQNGERVSGTEKKDSFKSKFIKRALLSDFDTSNLDLNGKKMKDIKVEELKPNHDKNRSDAAAFIVRTALHAAVPAYWPLLAADAYRGAKFISGKNKSKKYSEERNQNPIDKKTGFHLKTKELTDKEDLARVNPDINDFNSNTKSNCVLCTMTYELRRRGYDVTANKAGVGYFDNETKKWFPGIKYESIKNENTRFSDSIRRNYAKNVIAHMEKTQPEGARGNLVIDWTLGGAHSVAYEIKDGKMIIRDGQINKIYSNPERILSKCSGVRYARLDNLKFDPKAIRECCS